MVSETFTCDLCSKTFGKAWTDQEAEAEAVETFGALDDDMAIVCDDCWRMMGFGLEDDDE